MTAWTSDHVADLVGAEVSRTAIIDRGQVHKVLPGLDLWDVGPVRSVDGSTAQVCDGSLWIGLSAPEFDDPGARHDVAALRLFRPAAGVAWEDLGPLLDTDRAHGSRQWAASAVFRDAELWITYTAAGEAGEPQRSFKQRLYQVVADVDCSTGAPVLTERGEHSELFAPAPELYDLADQSEGRPGFIKAFRDPFPFRDPATGDDYILFAGSLPPEKSTTDFNGVIGIAHRADLAPHGWRLLDPLITADGVNNELERPHIVVRDGNYYLFFSTQARTFHPDVVGPTGLYGFVAPTLFGPYRPLNGHGLVFANPVEEPLQAYSWLVLDDLTTVSFVDAHSLRDSSYEIGSEAIAADRSHFGGTIAPAVTIGLEDDRAWIAEQNTALPD